MCIQANANTNDSVRTQKSGDTNWAEQLAAEYRYCTNTSSKLLFCIKLVDAEIIQNGTPLQAIKTIFGKDFADIGETATGLCAMVALGEWEEPESPDSPSHLDGWRLKLIYVSSKQGNRILSFSLLKSTMDPNNMLIYRNMDVVDVSLLITHKADNSNTTNTNTPSPP